MLTIIIPIVLLLCLLHNSNHSSNNVILVNILAVDECSAEKESSANINKHKSP